MSNALEFDVAIIGGGPAGATAGGFLLKHNPELRVGIFEREQFPRDHVGESQLPPIPFILDELGCWDKVEAANFPIKVGATYRWGKCPELWHLEFFPFDEFKEEARPAKFEGQRQRTAFQVDRSIYDKILLDHAESLGCEVFEGTKVTSVETDGDKVLGLTIAGARDHESRVTAKHYIDASGSSGILRRAMNISCDYPTKLQNIAIWEYWQNAEWAMKIGVGGTRIQVLSLPYGWIWFIPLGPTRTSIGLVVPASYYKSCGEKPADLFRRAIAEESIVAELTKAASSEGKTYTTRDWSFIAKRHVGQNWFLAGETAGFADPILSAGMTMAHMTGREAAFTILELDRGGADPAWLKEEFERRQSARIVTHIRFADYWYTANTQFKELKEFTAELASAAGLNLDPGRAWAWLSQGGFIDEDGSFGTGGFSLTHVKSFSEFISELAADSPVAENNIFELDLAGASWKDRAGYREGRVHRDACYIRGNRVLPVVGAYEFVVNLLQLEKTAPGILERVRAAVARRPDDIPYRAMIAQLPQALEAMIRDGWVKPSYDPTMPRLQVLGAPREIRWDHEIKLPT
ncbi:MAG TPA: NAD(P)/FAD-dependent oxidoreductase [Fimbriimonadaceae bacterium]|nr:NAD(P)/FAD-dependent oxidoreductase [Fimbriimonadaceae bacterium]